MMLMMKASSIFVYAAALLVILCVFAQPSLAAKKVGKAKKSPTTTEDAGDEKDPRDDLIKYKGLLQCRACEMILERLAVAHHTTPMPIAVSGVHDRRSKDKKLQVQLETRNAEITEELCQKMITEAARSKSEEDKADLQMLQLHCDRIMGGSETKFLQFLTSLAANETRTYVPVGHDKNEKTGKIKPKFVYEEESDAICKRYCVEKNSMKDQMAKMKDEITRKQREHMENISITEIFYESMSLIFGYWYLSVPAVVILTAIGIYIQIRYMAPRDDRGRPVLGRKNFDKAFVAPKPSAKASWATSGVAAKPKGE